MESARSLRWLSSPADLVVHLAKGSGLIHLANGFGTTVPRSGSGYDGTCDGLVITPAAGLVITRTGHASGT